MSEDVNPEFAKTLDALAQLCSQAISMIESAESDTSWGQPTFGPTYSEEKEEQIEALHEPLADLFIFLSGKRTHASDCATSSAPAYLPRLCDCDVPDTRKRDIVERLALSLRAYAWSRGASRKEDDEEAALDAARQISKEQQP